MSIIVLLIFIAVITKRTNEDRRKSDLFKRIIMAYIGISVLAGLLSSGGFVSVAVIGGLIWYYINKKQKKEKNSWQEAYERGKYRPQEDENRQQNGRTYQQRSSAGQSMEHQTGSGRFSQTQPDPMSKMESVLLARPLAKRKKVIREFNLKYRLTLTEAEVNRIAEASYVSEGWKREAEAMTRKYDTIGQWFQGPTAWLRVYMYAFQIQNISSDFAMQKQICIEALDEVISYGCKPEGMTIEERVQHINSRYFTYFDEMTFMIAWRFLEQEGRPHDLSQPDLVRNVDEDLEELEKKYRTG